MLVFVALFGAINLNILNVSAEENAYLSGSVINVDNFEDRGVKHINTVNLGNGVVCEVYEKTREVKNYSDSVKTTEEKYTFDFNLYVNQNNIGYLRQITKWKINKVSRPKFVSGFDKLYTIDADKYKMKKVSQTVENYKELAKMYTRRVTLEINGRAIGTTDFSTVVDKAGNASPVATAVN